MYQKLVNLFFWSISFSLRAIWINLVRFEIFNFIPLDLETAVHQQQPDHRAQRLKEPFRRGQINGRPSHR